MHGYNVYGAICHNCKIHGPLSGVQELGWDQNGRIVKICEILAMSSSLLPQ